MVTGEAPWAVRVRFGPPCDTGGIVLYRGWAVTHLPTKLTPSAWFHTWQEGDDTLFWGLHVMKMTSVAVIFKHSAIPYPIVSKPRPYLKVKWAWCETKWFLFQVRRISAVGFLNQIKVSMSSQGLFPVEMTTTEVCAKTTVYKISRLRKILCLNLIDHANIQ